MDHLKPPPEKPDNEHISEHHAYGERSPKPKRTFFTWLTSSSEVLGIFIAVAVVVTGSIIVFSNNAKKDSPRQEARKEKAQKEKLTTKNASSKLSANTKKIKKRVARAKRNTKLGSNSRDSVKDTGAIGVSVEVGRATPESLRVQADRRIAELWQAQNATYANEDLSIGLRSQIARKINGKITKIDSLKKRIPEDGSPAELRDIFKRLQDQKVYSCYLPTITDQSANEDLASLGREQGDVTKELRTVSADFKKEGKKTDRLNNLLNDRNKQVRQITSGIQAVRQSTIQAENTNCDTEDQVTLDPVTKDFDDLATLDEQIRQMVDQMLKEQGIRKRITTAPKDKKVARKEAREAKKAARNDKKNPTNKEPEPTASEEADVTPTEPEESEDPEATPELPPEEEEEEPSGDPLEKPDFAAFGLPNPQADVVSDLKAQIDDDERATWAVKELLKAEKTAVEKGVDIIPYLTTGWVWFENGIVNWPDPYEINCNDNRSGYFSEVSIVCKSDNFQVAGYQAAAQGGQYVSLFTKFYEPEELSDVVKRVASNSKNAIRPQWDYNDSGQQKGVNKQYIIELGSVTTGDISPNVDFTSEKGQYFSLLTGKDPNMVIALNSFAVSEDDLIAALKSGCAYDYICSEEKQILANMVGALYELDGGAL